ncbi:hypothetical protein BGZ60DRAFT_101523 [Tricladium varicosporioides]|nr:hypothetical protein BGZ60DRAFT_101523 [Hymenoscyphus varicosporioides]
MGFFKGKRVKVQSSDAMKNAENTTLRKTAESIRTSPRPAQENLTSELEPSHLFFHIPSPKPSEIPSNKPWSAIRDLIDAISRQRRKIPQSFRLRRNRHAQHSTDSRIHHDEALQTMPTPVLSTIVVPATETVLNKKCNATCEDNVCAAIQDGLHGAAFCCDATQVHQGQHQRKERIETRSVPDIKEGKQVEQTYSSEVKDSVPGQKMKKGYTILKPNYVHASQSECMNDAQTRFETNATSEEVKPGNDDTNSCLSTYSSLSDSEHMVSDHIGICNTFKNKRRINGRYFTDSVTIKTPTGNQGATLLYDTGSDENFIGERFADYHRLIKRPLLASDVDEYHTGSGSFFTRYYVEVEMQNRRLGTQEFRKETFLIIPTNDMDVELLVGANFMTGHDIDLAINGKRLLVITKRTIGKGLLLNHKENKAPLIYLLKARDKNKNKNFMMTIIQKEGSRPGNT